MKRNLLFVFAAVAIALSSCVAETVENEDRQNTPAGERQTAIRLSSKIESDTPTRAHIEDELGLVWEADDVVTWYYYHTGEANSYWNTSYTLLSTDIYNDGHEATYRGNLDAANLLGLFRYNTNGGNEVYFTDTATGTISGSTYSFTQSEAGVMNKTQIHLHSGTTCVNIDNTADADEQSVGMEIMGTVIRILPFTTSYNSETVSSVSFMSNSYISGCVRYHYGSAVSYDSINDVNFNRVKTVTVNLGTGFSLSGVTSKETSKGIYLSLPATESGISSIYGYTIKVSTDVADYYFESSKTLTLGNNKVKNFYLDLKNATRAVPAETTGSYWFDGNFAGNYSGASLNYPSAGVVNDETQYWLAYTSVGGAVDARYPADYPEFYSNTPILIRDSEGNTPSWVTCQWKANSHFIVMNVDANTSPDARTATIIFLPPKHVLTFDLRANEPAKIVTVTQAGEATVTPILYDFSSGTSPKGGSVISGKIRLQINGVDATSDQFDAYIGEVVLSATNGKIVRSGEDLTIYIGVNPTAASRDITVTATREDQNNSYVITQAANDAAIPQTFSYNFSAWQNSFDSTGRQLYFSNAAESGAGHWVAVMVDVAKDGVRYASDMPSEDKPLFIKYAFQLSDEDYTDLTSWLTFDVTGGAGEVKIIITDRTANTTGSPRTFNGYLYNGDLSSIKQLIIIRQDA